MGLESVRVGSAVVVIDHDRVLLGRRGKHPNFGRWVLPGGKVELFETLDAAAKREVAEETGLEIDVVARIAVDEIIDETASEHRLIVFSQARPVGGVLKASSDLLEVRFFTRDEAGEVDITPIVRSVLEQMSWLEPPALAAAS
jgi:8-oxo-dGTP diphosphatase